MDKILIKGGKPLLGTVEISGAKNAALPALAATLLTSDAVVLQNVPCVRDIQTTGHMLRDLGVRPTSGPWSRPIRAACLLVT